MKGKKQLDAQEVSFVPVKDNAVASLVKKCGNLDGKAESSAIVGFLNKLSFHRRFIKPIKYKVTRSKDESLIFYCLSYLGKILLSLDILNYGTFLLLFSITSFLAECGRL